MGWRGAAVDGMGADQRASRLHRLMATMGRPVRAVSGEFGGARVQRYVGRSISRLGMARAVLALDHHGRDRTVYPPRDPRNPCLYAVGRAEPHRTRAGPRGHQTAAERDHPDGAGTDRPAVAVLHLYRLRFQLRDDRV